MKTMAMLAVVLVGAAAGAQELRDPFQGMASAKRLLRGAELTDAQMSQLLEIRQGTWQREQQLVDERDAAWRAFKELFTSTGEADASKLGALAQQATELDAQLEQLKAEVLFRYRSVLSEPQLARVSEAYQTLESLKEQERAVPPTVAAEQ
ncbi:MAG TPA: hypothetical protein VMB50_18890 [Myxococcales bacterium]|nr:hypothetical protein [Myxococcales bacterium]